MRSIATLMLVSVIAGCGPAATPPAAPTEVSEPPPAQPEISAISWSPVGEIRTFDAQNLWDAINGAAEGYLAYGFVELTIQEFRTEGIGASVEVYDQGTPLGAFGVFRRDRPAEWTPIAIGDEAVLTSPHHCAMLSGARYVQARALEGELDEAGCRGLFHGLLVDLPGPHGLPSELDLLPTADRVTGSEGFTKESYLGLGELKDCIHAEYQGANDARPFQIFVCIAAEGRDGAAFWSELETKWKPVPSAGSPALHHNVPYTGEVVTVRTDSGILGVAGAGDLDASLKLLESVKGD
jgi:hypothetical protein